MFLSWFFHVVIVKMLERVGAPTHNSAAKACLCGMDGAAAASADRACSFFSASRLAMLVGKVTGDKLAPFPVAAGPQDGINDVCGDGDLPRIEGCLALLDRADLGRDRRELRQRQSGGHFGLRFGHWIFFNF